MNDCLYSWRAQLFVVIVKVATNTAYIWLTSPSDTNNNNKRTNTLSTNVVHILLVHGSLNYSEQKYSSNWNWTFRTWPRGVYVSKGLAKDLNKLKISTWMRLTYICSSLCHLLYVWKKRPCNATLFIFARTIRFPVFHFFSRTQKTQKLATVISAKYL